MATQPIPQMPNAGFTEPEPFRTREEWWEFVMSLEGSAKTMLAEVGGADAWIRFLRDEDEIQPASN